MSRIVLSGYYGFNNAGDELVLHAIIRTLREIDNSIAITVLSQQPEKTAKQYGVEAVNRWSVWGISKALSTCDLLISGGGSLLQDVTSANSPLYYLGIIFLAKLLGKKTMLYSQGIGPLIRKRNRKAAAWLINKLNLVTVRDKGSKRELLEMGVVREVSVVADPVLGLPGDLIDTQAGREILARNGIEPAEERLLGLFIRSWQDDQYLAPLVTACDKLAEEGWRIVFVPMQFPHDITAAKKAVKMMSQEAVCLKEMYDPWEILSLAKNFQLIVGMRLHALIAGVVVGVPVVGISYDPKIERFLQQIGQQSLNTVGNLNSSTLLEVINWTYQRREEIVRDLAKMALPLYKKAWQAARNAVELLHRQHDL